MKVPLRPDPAVHPVIVVVVVVNFVESIIPGGPDRHVRALRREDHCWKVLREGKSLVVVHEVEAG